MQTWPENPTLGPCPPPSFLGGGEREPWQVEKGASRMYVFAGAMASARGGISDLKKAISRPPPEEGLVS